ncbi:MAG: thioredoxin [Eubacterium sp.]
MAAIEINAQNFEEKVLQSDKPVLIDFWAVWCGPCSMMSPVVEQIGDELADKLVVGKINCDENMEIAQQYKVAGIPAFFLFKGGEVVAKAVGAMSKSELLAQIEPYLN